MPIWAVKKKKKKSVNENIKEAQILQGYEWHVSERPLKWKVT